MMIARLLLLAEVGSGNSQLPSRATRCQVKKAAVSWLFADCQRVSLSLTESRFKVHTHDEMTSQLIIRWSHCEILTSSDNRKILTNRQNEFVAADRICERSPETATIITSSNMGKLYTNSTCLRWAKCQKVEMVAPWWKCDSQVKLFQIVFRFELFYLNFFLFFSSLFISLVGLFRLVSFYIVSIRFISSLFAMSRLLSSKPVFKTSSRLTQLLANWRRLEAHLMV